MKLSVIVPAWNEEKLLPGCLESISQALRANFASDWACEVIVVDNNSTDRTAALARDAGAAVVFEPINQISRARNAGGALATGDWLLFIDADSYLHPATLAELLRHIRRGRCAGGGCLIDLDACPWHGRVIVGVWNFLSRVMKWAAGSFVFCRADVFREVGGFSTEMFAAEEIHFSKQLEWWARRHNLKFVILKDHRHVSSGRKFQLYSSREILALSLRTLLRLRSTLRDRSRLDIFYGGRR